MKKSICSLLAITISILFVFQTNFVAFANDETEWQDVSLSQEEINEILSKNPANQVSTYTKGLIFSYSIGVSCRSSNLLIAGDTICDPDVVKCGFKIVTIQRRKSSSYSWTTYRTYEDLYRDVCTYTLTKSIAVPTGYQYRVTCTHYAKKNIFSTEKINNTSNVIAIG